MKTDPKGFEQFVEMIFKEYYLQLRAYTHRFVNSQEEADDIVQEVFLELMYKRDTLRLNHQEIKSYLYTAVYHRSLNHLAQRNKVRMLPMEEYQLTESIASILDSMHKQLPQESLLMVDELSKAIRRCVEKFPTQRKKVFILSRSYQLKNREIAQQLGISIKAVEKHLTNALSTLRTFLLNEGFYLALIIVNTL